MAEAILTLNAGSSSLKFALFEIGDGDRLDLAVSGQIEGIERRRISARAMPPASASPSGAGRRRRADA